jgi:8-oxo-dGTP diphosphatase
MSSVIHVAIGIIINQDNQVLIAKRASHQHQGNKWEFPGGKVEELETSQQALQRELKEELGIEIQYPSYLINISYKYIDGGTPKKVLLDVYEVREWQGEVIGDIGKEGQPLLWVEKSALNRFEFPAANAEILRILC